MWTSFEDLVRRRQSTRHFSDCPVEIEKVRKICSIASLSPSSCNSQPWKMHIIPSSSDKVAKVRHSCQIVGLNPFLDRVSTFIVIEQVSPNSKSFLGGLLSRNDLNSIDLGILVAHICLAAEEENLGTCIIGAFRKGKMQKAMGTPFIGNYRLVIAVGYPVDNYERRDKIRKNPDQTISISK